jgi:hypothetical protein
MTLHSDFRTDLGDEWQTVPVESFLPIEKKIVAWSLGLGLVLLIVLAAINHVYSPGL